MMRHALQKQCHLTSMQAHRFGITVAKAQRTLFDDIDTGITRCDIHRIGPFGRDNAGRFTAHVDQVNHMGEGVGNKVRCLR